MEPLRSHLRNDRRARQRPRSQGAIRMLLCSNRFVMCRNAAVTAIYIVIDRRVLPADRRG